MKYLTITGITIGGGGTTATITGEIEEVSLPTIPAMQVSIPQTPPDKANWTRTARLNTEMILLLRNGSTPFALDLNTFAGKIAVAIEPTLSWAAVIVEQPENQEIVANGSNVASFNVSSEEVELSVTYQWQESVDNGQNWSNLSDGGDLSGATTTTLNIQPSDANRNGRLYRCIITNGAGSTTSDEASLTVTV